MRISKISIMDIIQYQAIIIFFNCQLISAKFINNFSVIISVFVIKIADLITRINNKVLYFICISSYLMYI